MGKKSVGLLVLLCLMILSVAFSQPIKAESQDHITINSDGSIAPSTSSLQRTGDIYSLSDDSAQSIWIYKSDMLLEGKGHTISGATLYILDSSNVTVKNLTIADSYQGISIADSAGVTITNDTIIGTGANLPFSETWAISIQRGNASQIVANNIIGNMVGFSFAETSNNLVVGNNIRDCSSIAFGLYNSSYNRIYRNNFINNTLQLTDEGIGLIPYMISANVWDNGSVGNYWSDYPAKYPNASELDSSGTGNTPYVLDSNNIDHYPLISQFSMTNPTPTLAPSPSLSPSPSIPEFPTRAILPLLMVATVLGAILIKRKKG